MNELQIFNYTGKKIRTVVKDNEVWFVAKDVCDILNLTNPTKSIKPLDDDEKNTLTISEGIGNPNKIAVNEAGLYSLVLRSNKPEAKQFKRWVIHEVLPSIRKTGGYLAPSIPSAPPAIDKAPMTAGMTQNLQMFKALFDNAVVQEKTLVQHSEKISEAEKRIREVEKRINKTPDFELPETTQDFDGLFLAPVTRYTAKAIGATFNISAVAVNRYLYSQGVHSPHKNGWKLNTKYANCDYVHQTIGSFRQSDGTKAETLITYWTALGKDFVCTLLRRGGLKQKGQVKPYNAHGARNKKPKSKSNQIAMKI